MVKIEPEWSLILEDYFRTSEYKALASFISQEYLSKQVYPQQKDVFRAFTLTPFSQVKVVILGQDPYHNLGQADGLCFSVPDGQPLPPSLKNIYKEISVDFARENNNLSGDLSAWARQGVLLLNAILTVVANQPTSHRGAGWENFTDYVIRVLSERKDKLVFMLWGNYARSKKKLIDTKKHLVLEAPHPSPLSAHNGFFGCRHFSQCNLWLKESGDTEIDW